MKYLLSIVFILFACTGYGQAVLTIDQYKDTVNTNVRSATAPQSITRTIIANLYDYLADIVDTNADKLELAKDSLRDEIAEAVPDTSVIATQTYVNNKVDSISDELNSLTLDDVASNDSVTTKFLTARALLINGFGSEPAPAGGWGLKVARNKYYDGVTGFDTIKANARSIQELSTISTTADYAVFDYLTQSYGEMIVNQDHFIASQYRTVVDYLPTSTLVDYHHIYSQLTPKRIDLTNAIDIEIEPLGSTGNPANTTNHIGVRVKDFKTGTNNIATNNWGVVVEGSQMGNYFGGGLKIAGSESFSGYGADFDTTLIVRDTAVFSSKVVLNGVSGSTEDSALALNSNNEIIKVPISSTAPTLQQVTTAGATTTTNISTAKITANVTSDNTAPVVVQLNNGGAGSSTGAALGFQFGQKITGQFSPVGLTFYDKNGTDNFYASSSAFTFSKSVTMSTSLANGRFTFSAENGASADVYMKSANGFTLNTYSVALGGFAERFKIANNGFTWIGSTAGTATSQLDLSAANGYTQFRMRTSYTPTGTADANGNTGDVAWDADYIYIKTGAGWKRATLATW